MSVTICKNCNYPVDNKITIVALLYVSWVYAGLFNQHITIPALLKGFFAALIAAVLEMLLLNMIISKSHFL
jgi:hypothetical protein